MRIRFRFSKVGKVRWTSHRDVARMWERALRRAKLPLAYTEGFSPRPQLAFGLALPTGCESTAEYVDVTMRHDVDAPALAGTLGELLPEGVDVMASVAIERGAASLQQSVDACRWHIVVPAGQVAQANVAARAALSAEHLPIDRERKGRLVVDDLRPSLRAIVVSESPTGEAVLVADLGTRPRGVRPAELAQVLDLRFGIARRTSQWIERDGLLSEPLAVEAPVTGAPVRVS